MEEDAGKRCSECGSSTLSSSRSRAPPPPTSPLTVSATWYWWATPHSEHRFPAPFAKLCQNWLRHWRGTLHLRSAVRRRCQRLSKGLRILQCSYHALCLAFWKMVDFCGSNVGSNHARKHAPGQKEEEKKCVCVWRGGGGGGVEGEEFCLDSNDLGFICAGVINVGGYKRNP